VFVYLLLFGTSVGRKYASIATYLKLTQQDAALQNSDNVLSPTLTHSFIKLKLKLKLKLNTKRATTTKTINQQRTQFGFTCHLLTKMFPTISAGPWTRMASAIYWNIFELQRRIVESTAIYCSKCFLRVSNFTQHVGCVCHLSTNCGSTTL
jgi:hypothetical protein